MGIEHSNSESVSEPAIRTLWFSEMSRSVRCLVGTEREDEVLEDWLREHLAQTQIQPLLADIKAGRVQRIAVMTAIQQMTDSEKREMKSAIDTVVDTLRNLSHPNNE